MAAAAFAPRAAFLTGATGFLGAFLLDELLRQTSGPVFCLVRAPSAQAGLERLLAAQAGYGLDTASQSSRIVAIPGDLTKPGLALSDKDRARLAAEVDQVIHSAASTNFLFNMVFLKSTNLGGTQAVADLALATRSRRLHYVSSASIFLSGRYGGQVVTEDQEPAPDDLKPAWGYQYTKWQGEHVLRDARNAADERLALSISRPWFMGPHAQTSAASDHDFMLRLMDGCLALGMAPDVDLTVNIMPIDYVARSIVHLALSAEPGCFYLGNPAPSRWHEVVQQLNEVRPVALAPYAQWRAALRADTENPAWIFLPLLPEDLAPDDCTSFLARMREKHGPNFSAPRTAERLADLPPCPVFHGEILGQYLSRR